LNATAGSASFLTSLDMTEHEAVNNSIDIVMIVFSRHIVDLGLRIADLKLDAGYSMLDKDLSLTADT
jgi:hypothetical protein